ncbi:uncharacterized protein E0L32_003529 [Thyridium curvatum]|uniref:Zn(2)-C6 fungal-type domain-containing protein n=1 Tax=Thyridium curvatum TaxID=1093900 RepID=A0A507BAR3_9PEZI|nr:uncharacterized protein E0L32_003529 [Thyridium curvatum]TPX16967.1 hypothetical protein E0L32_003529 [Thyridium curvatum]
MARKGSRKVKTGCITCKWVPGPQFQIPDLSKRLTSCLRIRKIKCDESRPACVKCTSTGRACDGYAPACAAQTIVAPWNVISVTPSLHVRDSEARPLEYFHRVVAPAISGHLDADFWTKLVWQAGADVAAVRHATIAISSLYEGFGLHTSEREHIALQHYNRSISLSISSTDQQEILLACILFVCIECLRGDATRAIEHCRHGISILNRLVEGSNFTPWIEDIRAVFSRLSFIPLFWGSTPDTFPLMAEFHDFSALGQTRLSQAELQRYLDTLISRSMRVVRRGDEYRLGVNGRSSLPCGLVREQNQLQEALQHWERAFLNLRSAAPLSPQTRLVFATLEVKLIIARIWVRNAFENDEGSYDSSIEEFQRVVAIASQVCRLKAVEVVVPKFKFDMGFMPLLYFVAIKCREVRTRLEAVKLMRSLAISRENLWDFNVMEAISRRVIELEHGLSFGELTAQVSSGDAESSPRPPSPSRVIDSLIESPQKGSTMSPGEVVTFFFPGEGGHVRVVRKWISM